MSTEGNSTSEGSVTLCTVWIIIEGALAQSDFNQVVANISMMDLSPSNANSSIAIAHNYPANYSPLNITVTSAPPGSSTTATSSVSSSSASGYHDAPRQFYQEKPTSVHAADFDQRWIARGLPSGPLLPVTSVSSMVGPAIIVNEILQRRPLVFKVRDYAQPTIFFTRDGLG
ncbi:hypothetical protein RvY_14078 [Ramazzottius varieornatus]|uniref:Uncharacterized protein n=1 Tax=Ramazzottius varieornatus TaxID=947166 RepID=A0A1D1VV71_RAMVA|nr:hypothetical protein RvY_14078 [Ramazzottius varieornatus]